MAKRNATHQLTAENFDDDEEDNGETGVIGEFSKATGDVMSQRVIKKAKRRMDPSESGASNPFSVFSSFKSSDPKKETFLSELSKGSSATSTFPVPSYNSINFGNSARGESQKFPSFSVASIKSDQNAEKGLNDKSEKDQNPFAAHTNGTDKDDKSKESNKTSNAVVDGNQLSPTYAEQITSLNVSFLKWIKQHIDENPLIDLMPVFKDYTKHMNDIEAKFGKSSGGTESAVEESKVVDKVEQVAAPSLQSKASKSPVMSQTTLSTLTSASESKVSDIPFKAPVASFFSAARTSTPAPPVASSKIEEKKLESKDEDDAEADGEVEKHERKTVVEDDAFFTTRCKLFFKKGAEWKELGVGMLYMKPLNNKTQLLVRMETAGGKVLLNISLHDSMPAGRVGKNNVSLVSVPNPPVFMKPADGDNSKPLNYLIRVKDGSEADNLLKLIKENKSTA